eukprot:CAMPEP_0170145182 /NCGR_PEP_ID=MMETSP0033_2-20121228/16372_1 /TAXON_ID=195969 /ORGANISM="Dolichomastix tenuilepis, Strain CCMP3274" /LENGTH=292 /DNA_ID=CAMNT_0010381721 /DNA_START=21 /DNA_END=901 /DNA_ORIENTATION=+
MGKVHGSLARAGKVRGQTPKVAKQDKKKVPKGRANKRMVYNRRFVNVVVGLGKKAARTPTRKAAQAVNVRGGFRVDDAVVCSPLCRAFDRAAPRQSYRRSARFRRHCCPPRVAASCARDWAFFGGGSGRSAHHRLSVASECGGAEQRAIRAEVAHGDAAAGGGAEPKLDLIEKFLSPQIASQMEYNKLLMLESARDVAIHDRDTGSTEVQVAQLTQRIEYMKTHMQTHKKDLSSRRGLQRMLESRQKLLRYLRGTDGERYGALIGRLGLKDSSFSESKYPARNTSGKRRRRG